MTTTPMEAPITETSPSRSSKWLIALKDLILHAIIQDRVIQKIYPGIMHFLIFWGFTIQIIGTIISILQYKLFTTFVITVPRVGAYLGFELIMDLAGLMIFIGGLMALFRRIVMRPKILEARWDDWYAIGMVLLIPIIGYCSEGFRIMASQPEWRGWSPIGNLFASFFATFNINPQAYDAFHQTFFWTHVGIVLIFVASVPFTKMRHLINGPLNILLRKQKPTAALEPIMNIEEAEKLGVGQVEEFPSIHMLNIDACVQCGRCEDVCPSTFSGMPYSPRVLIRDLRDAIHSTLMTSNGKEPGKILGDVMVTEYPWLCTMCGACIQACPLFVNPVDSVVELRRYLTLTTGDIPGAIGETLTGIERRGNPWSMPKENHAPYAKELGVKVLQPGDQVDILLFLGCAYGYDTRSQQAGRALLKILQDAKVDFGILGPAEACCGETARRMGHEYLFQVMAKENIETFASIHFNRLVTPCAHGYSTFKNEYPQFGGKYQVLHHTELLAELIKEGRIKVTSDVGKQLHSYHDSCYLGRYNEIYQEPRSILNSIPNLNLIELPRSKKNGFCCGGGGGHMWMEIDPATRINHRRLDEVVNKAHADTVVTACPYCLIMFEDAIRAKGMGESVKAMDISEIIRDHLDTGRG